MSGIKNIQKDEEKNNEENGIQQENIKV